MQMSVVSDQEVTGNRDYKPLFEKLTQLHSEGSEDWVRISLADVAGEGNQAKQASLWQAAMVRKMRVQTRILSPWIHVRISRREKHLGGGVGGAA